MLQREQIRHEAMQLPSQDRAYVADVLEQSLNGVGFATPELAGAWAIEIERRIGAYDRGEMPAAEKNAAFARIRLALTDFRARKAAS